ASLGGFIQSVGELERLNWLDEQGKAVTINTPSWKKVFDYVLTANRNGAIRLDSSSGPDNREYSQVIASRQSSMFISGKAAMSVDSSNLLSDLIQLKPKFNW